MKQLMDSPQEMVNDCGNGLVALFTGEKILTVMERTQTGIDSYEDTKVTKYEYDYTELHVDGPVTTEKIVSALKDRVLAAIIAYDKSSAVNSFTIDGKEIWLDRDTRLALRQRFAAEQASGIAKTSIHYGSYVFNLDVSDALKMLNAIEVYACKCYDNTEAHKAAVKSNALTGIEEVLAYDYKQGYPEKPSFTTKASTDEGKTTNDSTDDGSMHNDSTDNGAMPNDSTSSEKASSTSK